MSDVSTQPMKCHCMMCEHIWSGTLLCNVAVSVWAAHIKTIHCPQCGASYKKVGFVDDEAKLQAAIDDLLKPKTEEQLTALDRPALMRIIRAIARLTRVEVERIVPKKSSKDLIVDSILDHFEDKVGS